MLFLLIWLKIPIFHSRKSLTTVKLVKCRIRLKTVHVTHVFILTRTILKEFCGKCLMNEQSSPDRLVNEINLKC